MRKARFKFGDILENGWASKDNPHRVGVFIEAVTKTQTNRAGLFPVKHKSKYARCRHDDGKTTLHPYEDEKLIKIGNQLKEAHD